MRGRRELPKSINRWKRQKVRLLVVAGKRKTGKDVFVDYVLKNYPGFKHYRIADGPDLIAKILKLPIERRIQHALFGVNALLYPFLGEAAYKRRVAKLLDRDRPRLAVVEAVRTKEEYEEFVVKRGGILIGVEADDRIRYLRAIGDAGRKHRKQDEDKMSFRQFIAKEDSPMECEIDWIVRRAHFKIRNNYEKPTVYRAKIDEVMRELGFRKRRKRN